MGQRHQIYCFVKQKNYSKKKDTIHQIAFHNQWCFGTLPLGHLERIIRFQTNANIYSFLGSEFSEGELFEKIKMILSCDPHEGFFQHYSNITNEVRDEISMHPEQGDNNDGITIIHINKEQIQYCFMNIGEGDSTIMKAPPKLPLSAEDYVKLYYSPSDNEWSAFNIDNKLSYINHRTKVLTILQCVKLFPDFYTEEEKKAVTCAYNELPVHMGQSDIIDKIVEMRLKGQTEKSSVATKIIWEEKDNAY